MVHTFSETEGRLVFSQPITKRRINASERFLVTGYRVRESFTQTSYKPNIRQDEEEGRKEEEEEEEEDKKCE